MTEWEIDKQITAYYNKKSVPDERGIPFNQAADDAVIF